MFRLANVLLMLNIPKKKDKNLFRRNEKKYFECLVLL